MNIAVVLLMSRKAKQQNSKHEPQQQSSGAILPAKVFGAVSSVAAKVFHKNDKNKSNDAKNSKKSKQQLQSNKKETKENITKNSLLLEKYVSYTSKVDNQ